MSPRALVLEAEKVMKQKGWENALVAMPRTHNINDTIRFEVGYKNRLLFWCRPEALLIAASNVAHDGESL